MIDLILKLIHHSGRNESNKYVKLISIRNKIRYEPVNFSIEEYFRNICWICIEWYLHNVLIMYMSND